jgi:hypothetical protein
VIPRAFIAVAIAITSSACAAPTLMDQTLELNSRHIRVTVENRSSRAIAISFDSNTMLGNRLVEPGQVDTVLFDPEPDRPAGGIPGWEETWALAWGNAVKDPAGSYIGLRTPIQQIAVSRQPLEPTLSEILVVIGDEDAGWRLITP